jgi:sulfur transfer complex TusBCD TusB component (DsrH family)
VITESAIDALSFLQIHPQVSVPHLLSLNGVGMATLERYLEEWSEIAVAWFALDGDRQGRHATEEMVKMSVARGLGYSDFVPPNGVKD